MNKLLIILSKRVTSDNNRGGVSSSLSYLLQKIHKSIKIKIDSFRYARYNILVDMCDYVLGL